MRRPRHKGMHWVPDPEWGNPYRVAELAGEEVSEGGWYYGRCWLTGPKADAAEDRWLKVRHEASPTDKDDWVAHQCGGCRYFAALNADWGICWCEASPWDGHVMFEHVGCEQHSDLEPAP